MAIILTHEKLNVTDQFVDLSWSTNESEDLSFAIYRKPVKDTKNKALNKPAVKIYDIPSNVKDYRDEKCVDLGVPDTPILLECYQIEDNKLMLSYTANDVGTVYEYYIEGKKLDGSYIVTSNKVEVTVTSGIKEYKIAVSQTEGERDYITDDDKLIITKEDRMLINAFDGYNSLFIYAVDHNNNVSECFIKTMYLKKTQVTQKTGRVPNAVKNNNRYRGPHESKKANALYMQVRQNINKLKDIVDELDVKKQVFFEKSINYNSKLYSLSSAIEETMWSIKE